MTGRAPPSFEALVTYTRKVLEDDEKRMADAGIDAQPSATLDYSSCELHSLPLELVNIFKDRVERLAISHNYLQQVPAELRLSKRLRYLNLRSNKLPCFPDVVLHLPALEILDLSKNMIEVIPEDIKNITSLKFLAIQRNRIRRLPLALGDMPSLCKLIFEDNPIEFPPPEVYQLRSATGNKAEAELCQQVKRFLRSAASWQRSRTSDERVGNADNQALTPRPPKRSVTLGRFPIRPSRGAIQADDGAIVAGPSASVSAAAAAASATVSPPPIPVRSHARDQSAKGSQSENIRARRQGFVPHRSDTSSRWNDQSTTIRPFHARDFSSLSVATSSSETHLSDVASVASVAGRGRLLSGPERSQPPSFVAPNEPPLSHVRGFVSFTASETSSIPSSPVGSRHETLRPRTNMLERRPPHGSAEVRALRRLLYSLFQLCGPVGDAAAAVKDSRLENLAFGANLHVYELDRLVKQLDGSEVAVGAVVLTAVAALDAYAGVARELRRHAPRIIMLTDAAYVRYLMMQLYMTILETRNVCVSLGYAIVSTDKPRESRARSSRTATPTQSQQGRRSGSNGSRQRQRGVTMLQNIGRPGAAPVVPLQRSASSIGPVRNEEDRVIATVRRACDMAAESLPRCMSEFILRKKHADAAAGFVSTETTRYWARAVHDCEVMMAAHASLANAVMHRSITQPQQQREIWQLCDSFVRSWTDLATNVRNLPNNEIDIKTVRAAMRPVQRAVKDLSKSIAESPLYSGPTNANRSEESSPFVTPLAAALGQAVHAGIRM
ncbi:hypothetical protein K470DRAFT_254302 [Piedraia hortae CBS 480.64]|uniref:L domain-like protein n=1 Tax=Piedraia hortae CBS 480.64 TaxID=1314780 RepID=A0A6A7C8Z6_9PEZI|nr:hypothetical protein K470DRAFT_254302 [Piedraia hortae CBS 480.64]